MIVVFVVDTSPSMGQPVQTSGSTTSMLSRLDVAKMAVEDLVRGLTRRVQEHNIFLQQQSPAVQKSMCQLGLGYCPPNQYLLLSTGRQHTDQPATAACGAGGRLLVGYGPDNIYSSTSSENMDPHFNSNNSGDGSSTSSAAPVQSSGASSNTASFQRELKQLQAATWEGGKSGKPFPEDAGGAAGLNSAVSAGLQLLSRYRLHDRATEHFGMGRLPNSAMMTPAGTYATHALQPACLVLLTDGACLRKSPPEGGGSLQLQYGNMPLRDWYKEPFRWDQRIICLGIGKESVTSTQYLHPHLRALCEVTGGYHTMLQSTASLNSLTDRLLRVLAPPLPRELPLSDPLKSPVTSSNTTTTVITTAPGGSSTFVNAGPVCCFQALEGDMGGDGGGQGTVYRAMLLYTPFPFPQLSNPAVASDTPEPAMFAPPLWCIPENYFPSKKLETLPPRPAQPLLMISRFPSKLGNKSFEPTVMMKQLHRLDQLVYSNRQMQQQPQQSNQQPQAPLGAVKLLHRDVYVCEWVSVDDRPPKYPQPNVYGGSEYFPVMVPDAGRPSGDDTSGVNYFHIGILHVPTNTSTLASSTMSASSRPFSTLTLLPPEPQILVPLLIKAADAEHRALKKAQTSTSGNTNNVEAMAAISRGVQVDEPWKVEFRSYLARLPPYYQTAMKRGLRSVLPTSLHPLLVQALASEPSASSTASSAASGSGEASLATSSIPLQCFSKTCFQKIRNAEQVAKDNNERLERQEAELRGIQKAGLEKASQQQQSGASVKPQLSRSTSGGGQSSLDVGYGQYDPRSGTESFLSALRGLPAPWLVDAAKKRRREHDEALVTKDIDPSNAASKPEAKADNAKSADGLSEMAVSVKSEPNNGESKPPKKSKNAMESLGDLPADCLMAFYESRRRWMFGGSGLTTRGLMVEGVNNDGCNVQRCGAKPDDFLDQSLLSLAGVGVSTLNETTVTKMGDYRERLLWSRSPVVGCGSNDSFGVAATTSADGSPKWSVDDDAMPMSFFDPKTGEFADSVQARLRSRLHVAFGNPFKLRWADSIVPEKFLSQCPSNHQHTVMDDSSTPPGSPPHDSYSSDGAIEEGEAIFNRSPPPKSPTHSSGALSSIRLSPPLHDDTATKTSHETGPSSKPRDQAGSPPRPPTKRAKTEDKGEPKLNMKQSQPSTQRPKSDLSKNTAAAAATTIPITPSTPPVPPPKMKTSPGVTSITSSALNSPKPPPPPLKSPKTGPSLKAPPPKLSSGKKAPPGPPPPPPGPQKVPPAPPPPALEKRPSFSLAPSKPLPNLPLKRPSSFSSQGSAPPPPPLESSTSVGSISTDSAGKKVPPPPKLESSTSSTGSGGSKAPPGIPKPNKLESASSTGSAGSATGVKQRQAPPPPKPLKPPPPKPPLVSTTKDPTLPPKQPLEYTNKDQKPSVDLPPGWMCVWSKSQRRWYFFDTRSNRSVWEWPPPGGT